MGQQDLGSIPGAVSEGHVDGDNVALGQEGVEILLPADTHLVKPVRLLVPVIVQPLHTPQLHSAGELFTLRSPLPDTD